MGKATDLPLALWKANLDLQLRIGQLIQDSGREWIALGSRAVGGAADGFDAPVRRLLREGDWQGLAALPVEAFWRPLERRVGDGQGLPQVARRMHERFAGGLGEALQDWRRALADAWAAAGIEVPDLAGAWPRARAAATAAAAKKPAAKRTAAGRAASKKAASKKAVPRKGAAKKTAAKKTVAKKTAAKKTAAKKTAAKKTAAKKTVAKKTVAKKAVAKKAVAKTSVAKKSAAKRTAAKKPAAKKPAARKTAAKKTVATGPVAAKKAPRARGG